MLVQHFIFFSASHFVFFCFLFRVTKQLDKGQMLNKQVERVARKNYWEWGKGLEPEPSEDLLGIVAFQLEELWSKRNKKYLYTSHELLPIECTYLYTVSIQYTVVYQECGGAVILFP